MAAPAYQRYLAEFLGTFGLLLVGGGSAVFSLGAVTGLALEGTARVILVSLAFGSVLTGLIYVFGNVSGGHFNPAVTVSMLARGRLPLRDLAPYLVAQVLGGIVGIGVVAGIASGNPTLYTAAQSSALASQCYAWSGVAPAGCGFSLASVLLIEIALSFVFILVIQRVTRPESGAKNLAPVAIGLLLLVTNLVAIPVDGASLNPVRSFSPALLSAVWSGSRWAIEESWAFWVAPIVGGLFAALVDGLMGTESS